MQFIPILQILRTLAPLLIFLTLKHNKMKEKKKGKNKFTIPHPHFFLATWLDIKSFSIPLTLMKIKFRHVDLIPNNLLRTYLIFPSRIQNWRVQIFRRMSLDPPRIMLGSMINSGLLFLFLISYYTFVFVSR